MGALPVAEEATRASGRGRQMTMPLVGKEDAGHRNSKGTESKNLHSADTTVQTFGAKIFRLRASGTSLKMTRSEE